MFSAIMYDRNNERYTCLVIDCKVSVMLYAMMNPIG